MNRFIRCSLIAGVCLSVIGFSTAIAARVNGGNWEQLNLRNRTTVIEDSHRHYHSDWEENIAQVSLTEEIDENTMRFPVVSELKLSLEACELTLTEGEEEGIVISCDSYPQMRDLVWISQDGEELVVNTVKKDSRTPKINVIIPLGHLFDELNIEMASGNCVIQNTTACEANFQCANGSISYEGLILGDADVQCSGGNVSLDLQQAEEEFNYEIEGSMGEMTIGTQDFSGIAYKKEIFNQAEWTMELHCAAGKIQINYLGEATEVN